MSDSTYSADLLVRTDSKAERHAHQPTVAAFLCRVLKWRVKDRIPRRCGSQAIHGSASFTPRLTAWEDDLRSRHLNPESQHCRMGTDCTIAPIAGINQGHETYTVCRDAMPHRLSLVGAVWGKEGAAQVR